uniref:uncharacterized protein LOC117715823 isoform X3 n=1 Tax=Arvicanthis niloticus TaxID=61156 RepID=UPI00402B2A85
MPYTEMFVTSILWTSDVLKTNYPFFLRCQCSLRNASSKDKDNIKMKMNHLGGAKPKVRSVKDGIRRSRCLLQAPGREAPRRESAGRREDSSVLVEIGGERTQEVCPVTPV